MIVDIQTILLWAILIGGLVYETTMWIYNRIKTGEQFSLEKYAMTYGYVALFAVVTYYATGAIPAVGDVMVNLTAIPDVAAFLPLITALFLGLFQQGSKKIAARQTTVATVPTITPSGTSGTTAGGRGRVAGIYGGSAAGNTPQNSLTFDINQVPTLFFDLIGVEVGVIAMKIAIDGVVLTKWVSDIISTDNGAFTGKVTVVGERMPFAFYMWNNFMVPGTHIVTISTGQFDSTGKNPTWLTSDNFTVTLTGQKPLE
jgi:hypothetical protein